MNWLRGNLQNPRSSRGRLFSLPTIISFVVAGAFLFFLVTRFDIDLNSTWESFKSSNHLYFLLALLVHYTTFIFRGARWRLLLENAREDPASFAPTTRYCGTLILLAWFVNSVTWFRLGDAYRAHTYGEDTGGRFSHTIGTILAERFLDVVLVLLLLLLATLFLVATGTGTSWVFVGLAAIMVGVLAAALWSMGFFRSRLSRDLPGPLQEAYQRFNQGTMGSFRRLHLVTLMGLLGWLAEMGRLFFVAEALDLPLSVPLVIFVTLANAMLTLVPFTPGGLGAVELGVTGLLMLSDNIDTQTVAFSVVALDRSISWLSVIAVGASVFIGREVIRKRRSRAAVASEAASADG